MITIRKDNRCNEEKVKGLWKAYCRFKDKTQQKRKRNIWTTGTDCSIKKRA